MAPLSRHLYRQDLLCPYSRHPPIYKSRSAHKYPAQALASASTSDAHKFSGINNHKVYAAIPGEPNPVLLKDCGAESNCAASLPFYRTTQLFSKITTGGQTSQSASVTLSITGNGIPKPTLTLLSKPSPNQAVIKIDAPTGETIGFTTLVAGVTEGNTAVALCDQSTCEVTIQFSTPQQYTSFTDVGGKLESSNTLNLEP